jgi:hypothetical protein
MKKDDSFLSSSSVDILGNTHFELGGASSRAMGWTLVLLDEVTLGSINEKQKEALLAIKKEIETITNLDRRIVEWFHHQEKLGKL